MYRYYNFKYLSHPRRRKHRKKKVIVVHEDEEEEEMKTIDESDEDGFGGGLRMRHDRYIDDKRGKGAKKKHRGTHVSRRDKFDRDHIV